MINRAERVLTFLLLAQKKSIAGGGPPPAPAKRKRRQQISHPSATFARDQRVPKPSQHTTHRMATHLLDPNAPFSQKFGMIHVMVVHVMSKSKYNL